MSNCAHQYILSDKQTPDTAFTEQNEESLQHSLYIFSINSCTYYFPVKVSGPTLTAAANSDNLLRMFLSTALSRENPWKKTILVMFTIFPSECWGLLVSIPRTLGVVLLALKMSSSWSRVLWLSGGCETLHILSAIILLVVMTHQHCLLQDVVLHSLQKPVFVRLHCNKEQVISVSTNWGHCQSCDQFTKTVKLS